MVVRASEVFEVVDVNERKKGDKMDNNTLWNREENLVEPISHTSVEGVSPFCRGKVALENETDEKGITEFSVDKERTWIFRANYKDKDKSIENLYDGVWLTSTLTLFQEVIG